MCVCVREEKRECVYGEKRGEWEGREIVCVCVSV